MQTIQIIQEQNFLTQALPVFVGALAAFILSLVAFLLRGLITRKSEKKQLLNNLARELRYNLSVIDDLKKEINAVLPKILAGSKEPYIKLRYNKFLGTFIQESYRGGILFELLSEYDLASFDEAINHYTDSPEEWLRSRLTDVVDGKIKKEDAVSSFQFELERLDSHKKVINDVLSKVGSRSKNKDSVSS